MNTLIMAALCAGVALGILTIVQGLRGRKLLPDVSRLFPDGTTTTVTVAWFVAAGFISLFILVATGWPGAAFGIFLLIVGAPRLVLNSGENEESMARTEAVANWTEMIRDNMAGAAGLEQALAATADIAPNAILPEVRRFAQRIETTPLPDALAILGEEIDHPSADLVVVSLANAARMEGKDLGPLLGRLADSIRADVRMRMRIEVGRARVRTSSRIVLTVIAVTISLIFVFGGTLMDAYDSLTGQLFLMFLLALLAFALWLMKVYSRVALPERFSARQLVPLQQAGVSQ